MQLLQWLKTGVGLIFGVSHCLQQDLKELQRAPRLLVLGSPAIRNFLQAFQIESLDDKLVKRQ